MHEIVQKALDLASSIRNMLGNEYGLYIADTTHYLCCDHGVIKLKLNVGELIKPESISGRSMLQNTRLMAKVGPEVYGVPYVGVAEPLHDEFGKVVGAMAYIFPARVGIIREATEAIELNTLNISAATQELSAGAEQFAATTEEFGKQIMQIGESVQATDQIIELIQNVSKHTHLLGLNARIEAARAGDTGRGFAVVAEEIQKMADNVKGAVKDVTDKLSAIQTSVKSMSYAIEEVAAGAENQANATMDISKSVEKLHQLTNDIMHQADQLVQ